jgi:hypothetical protein
MQRSSLYVGLLVLGIVLLGLSACDPLDDEQASTADAGDSGKVDEVGGGPQEESPQEEPIESPSVCTEETECAQIINATPNQCVFFMGFDGSGVYSPDAKSNIGRLYEYTSGREATSRDGMRAGMVSADTTRAYIEGVPGLPFGASAERVDRGLSAVCQHLDKRPEPCDIVMMGYSRGAIIANMVAKALNNWGCGSDGDHRGAEIAFFAAFDPVHTQMGYEWKNRYGNSQAWGHRLPDNVLRFQQVYKDPRQDPRGWPENATLTSMPHNAEDVVSQCSRGLTASEHPESDDWHHGQIGHGTLPREIVLCALESHGIFLDLDRDSESE